MAKKLVKEEALSILGRYVVLLVLALGNLVLFYKSFRPITVYPALLILKVFYGSLISFIPPSAFVINGLQINLIDACIAGAAYYFLLILNLTTPMKPKVRTKSIIFLFASFLIVNIIRVVIFAVLAVHNYSDFNEIHLLTWYFGSTLLLVVLWFCNIYLFKIKSIPVYTDLKRVLSSFNA